MARLFGLTAEQHERVAAAVKDFERPRTPTAANAPSGSSAPTPGFWAELTGEDTSNPGHYSFKKKMPKPADFKLVESDPTFETGEDFTAIEVNGIPGLKGENAWLTFIGYDTSDPPKAIYFFSVGGSDVWVKVTGNASGGGKYNGRIVRRPTSAPALTGNVAESDFGTLPSADDCYILNAAEVGKSTHDLTEGTPVTKMFPGHYTGKVHTDKKPFIRISGVDWKVCTS